MIFLILVIVNKSQKIDTVVNINMQTISIFAPSIEVTDKIHMNLLNGENILYAERKHWISLFSTLFIHPIILFITIASLLFILKLEYPVSLTILTAKLTLCLLCVLGLLGTFNFMDWYFEFYVITNQRLVKIHYFRIVGTHYDEIF